MPTLIDSHVSVKQAKLAIDALLKHNEKHQAEKEEKDLLGSREEVVWLGVTVKKVHPEKKLKPFSIPLARPIVDPRTTSICLITKDPQREYKDLLAAQNVKFISRVVGVTKLKGKFKPFEARRQLMNDHGLFLADERVVPLMPKLLGKIFLKSKKQPIPVSLQKKDIKAELERAVSSTYMHQNQGTQTSVKIAPTSFTPAQVLDNLTTALPSVVKNIKGGWENVQSLHIKTSASVALPIWSCDLGAGEGGRWSGLVGASEESEEDEDGSEESEESEEEPAPVQKEGKKRAAGGAPIATTASKKAKPGPSDVELPSKTKGATAVPKSTAVPPPKSSAKKTIPRTPIVEESSSEEEPEPKPLPKAKPAAEVKKKAATGIEQKKAKVLEAKGLARKGSKAGIVGTKKISR